MVIKIPIFSMKNGSSKVYYVSNAHLHYVMFQTANKPMQKNPVNINHVLVGLKCEKEENVLDCMGKTNEKQKVRRIGLQRQLTF